MREILFIFILVVAIFAIAYITVLLALALNGCLMFLKYIPEWTWTVVLLGLTIATVRGLRYSSQ